MVNATKVLVTSGGNSAEAVLIDDWHAVIYTDIAGLEHEAAAKCTIQRDGQDDDQVTGQLLVGTEFDIDFAGVELATDVEGPYEATRHLPKNVPLEDALEALAEHVGHWTIQADNDDAPWIPDDSSGHIEGVVHWVCVLLRGRRC